MPRTRRETPPLDDTAEIQRAIDNDSLDAVTLSPRDYNISRSLVANRKEGLIIEGHGPRRTRLLWRRVDSIETPTAMICCNDCFGPTIRDLSLTVDPSQQRNAPVSALAAKRTTREAGVPTSTRFCADNVVIDGFYCGVNLIPQENMNNEHAYLNRVAIYNSRGTAIVIAGTNSKEHVINQCTISNAPTGIYVNGGGFTMTGGSMAQTATALQLSNPSDPVIIQGTGFEAVRRLLASTLNRREAYDVTLIGIRVMCDQLNPDDRVLIDFGAGGPLNIIGGQYGDGVQLVPRIRVQQQENASTVVNLIGPRFGSFGSYEQRNSIVSANTPGRVQGLHTCTFTDRGGTARHYTENPMVSETTAELARRGGDGTTISR